MNIMQNFALWIIPLLLLCVPIIAYMRGVNVYEVFCEGAKEGAQTAFHILPYLVAMFVALGVLRSGKAFDALLSVLEPFGRALSIPQEVIPLALLRPLSGSGALGMLAELLGEYGADSMIGLIASTMQGSTETTFYILTVYFGSVGITRSRHAVPVGLAADLAGFIASIVVVRWMFF